MWALRPAALSSRMWGRNVIRHNFLGGASACPRQWISNVSWSISSCACQHAFCSQYNSDQIFKSGLFQRGNATDCNDY